MINTSLPLTDARVTYLKKLLDDVPTDKRGIVWQQVNMDITKIKQIWENIDKINRGRRLVKETNSRNKKLLTNSK